MSARIVLVAFCFGLFLFGAAHAESLKTWNVLVFLNADNNLDSFGVKDLAEMEKVGSTDDVNVIVQMDRYAAGAKRYFVRKGTSELLEDMGEVDMGSETVLVDFASWATKRFPARRTALILWNHGSGWQKKDQTLRGISYDDQSGNHISTEELETAVSRIAGLLGHKIDILAFDACLMNMVEVAYQVRKHVEVMVGSEETEPGDGWPYDKCLAPLTRKPGMSPRALAAIICDEFCKSYFFSKSTQSALACSELDGLRIALDAWCRAVMDDGSGEALRALSVASEKVARFAYASYADLFGLLKLFRKELRDGTLIAKTEGVLALREAVVVANEVHAFPLSPRGIYGLAIHFPQGSSWWSAYRRLAFARDGLWDEMLEQVLGKALPGEGAFETLHGNSD